MNVFSPQRRTPNYSIKLGEKASVCTWLIRFMVVRYQVVDWYAAEQCFCFTGNIELVTFKSIHSHHLHKYFLY